jgi:hypothetical protein
MLEAAVVEAVAVATTGATSAGVGRLAAAVIVAIGSYSKKRSSQRLGTVCMRESFLNGKKVRPAPIRLENKND